MMRITLELSGEWEQKLQQAATRKGVDTEVFVYDLIRRRFQPRRASSLALTPEEQGQLDSLNAELPPAFWERYQTLQQQVSGVLPDAERAEFVALTRQAEAWNVRRLTLLEAFAQKRGVHFPQLMRRLHLRHHPSAPSA